MLKIYSESKNFFLQQIDNKLINDSYGNIRCFIIERNERNKLPYLLKYYRNLGVDEFFIVDDHSGDGSREYVLEQQDCYIFEPSDSFKESRAGVDWQNLLLDTFGCGHWTLVVDADELLTYPHLELINIKLLCKFLDSENSNLFFSFLLDMYPVGDLGSGKCIENIPFTEICPYFDNNYTFRKISNRSSNKNEFPRIRVIGGPRIRLFYPWQKRGDFFSRLVQTVIIKVSERVKFFKGDRPHYAPALIKMPLVKWQKGYKRLSNHVVFAPTNGNVASITGATLHFKFFADFHEKAINEVSRGEHFGGSLEYRRYLKYIKNSPNISLHFKSSRRYVDSSSLINEKLINSSTRFNEYVANFKNSNL
jgi:hypothetical protein